MEQEVNDDLTQLLLYPIDTECHEYLGEEPDRSTENAVNISDLNSLLLFRPDYAFSDYYAEERKKEKKAKKKKYKEKKNKNKNHGILLPDNSPEGLSISTKFSNTGFQSSNSKEIEQIDLIAEKIVSQKPTLQKIKSSRDGKSLEIYSAAQRLWEYNLASIVDGKLFLRIDGVDVPAEGENLSTTVLSIMSEQERIKVSRGAYFNDVSTMLRALKREHADVNYTTIELYSTPIIKFSNGIFNVATGYRYFNGENYKHCFYELKAAFIPRADLETPVMDRVIDDATDGDEECIQLFWAVLGMLLLPDIRAKKMYVFGTARHSGKTQILDFLNAIYGEYSSTCNLNKLGESYETASIVGKYLCYDGDLSNEALQEKAVGVIKKITGGDVTKTRQIFCSHEDNKLLSKLVVATNHPIKLKRPDEAFWDRVVIVPFVCTKSEGNRDANLLIKLLDERDAIVTKAILCGLQVIDNNYQFPSCAVAESMLADWAEGPDLSVEEFLADYCILSADKCSQYGETTNDLYKAYFGFCQDVGCRPMNENNFAKYLSNQKGLVRKRFPGGRGFLGIELIDNQSDAESENLFKMPL